jgi:CO dehydrogenase maturation factor
MEAGIEHLGRGTAGAVDGFIIVVEPGLRSLGTAEQIRFLASEIGVPRIYLVANKVRTSQDEEFIRSHSGGLPLLGSLPFTAEALAADQGGIAVFDGAPTLVDAAERIVAALESNARV